MHYLIPLFSAGFCSLIANDSWKESICSAWKHITGLFEIETEEEINKREFQINPVRQNTKVSKRSDNWLKLTFQELLVINCIPIQLTPGAELFSRQFNSRISQEYNFKNLSKFHQKISRYCDIDIVRQSIGVE